MLHSVLGRHARAGLTSLLENSIKGQPKPEEPGSLTGAG